MLYTKKVSILPELGSEGSGGKGSNFCDPFLISTGLVLLPVSIVLSNRVLFDAFLFLEIFSPSMYNVYTL